MKISCFSEVDQIQSLLLKHPKDGFVNPENISRQWQQLHYSDPPDFEKASAEYEYFISLLQNFVPDIHFLPLNRLTGLDSIYVHDPVIITDRGAILCNMGKAERQKEPGAIRAFLNRLKIPILAAIREPGKLEGGDILQFDKKTIAVAQGYRTNSEGIRQLKQITKAIYEEIFVVPLPHWQGADDVLHLMSIISPVDHDLAVVYSKLMPVIFRQWLLGRGINLIEVPDDEYQTMACNILTVAPRKCIMIAGNPKTKNMLENNNVQVLEYSGEEISKKGAGGPTCLTRPLLRIS